MEFLGRNSSAGMTGSGSRAAGQSGSFVVQGASTANAQGIADLLKQVNWLMAAAKEEKVFHGKN